MTLLHNQWMRNLSPQNLQVAGVSRLTDFCLKGDYMSLTTRTSAFRSSTTTMTTLWWVTLGRQKPSNSLGGTSTGLVWEEWLTLTSALVQTVHTPKHHATNHMESSSNYPYLINHGTQSPWTS